MCFAPTRLFDLHFPRNLDHFQDYEGVWSTSSNSQWRWIILTTKKDLPLIKQLESPVVDGQGFITQQKWGGGVDSTQNCSHDWEKNSQIDCRWICGTDCWLCESVFTHSLWCYTLALAEPLKQHESFKNDKRKHIESFFELLIRTKKTFWKMICAELLKLGG